MKYLAYCRKSTDEKDRQVLSIEAQITELKEFAQKESLEVIDFISESKTAKQPGREKFDSLLRRIEKGEAQGILSWHADRLARNSVDGGKIIYLLDTGKLQSLKFPTLWFENTPQGKFMLGIAFNQSKYYVDNLSENVKRGLRQKLRRGVWPSKAFLGYVNNPKTREIDIDPETSKVVLKAFEIFAGGQTTFVGVAKFLATNGIVRKDGKPWYSCRTKRLLTNKFYVGVFYFQGEFHEGTHQCFIPKELFARVQEQIKRIERPQNDRHNFAFRGLARCGECQAAITAETHEKFYKRTDRHARYNYYHCTHKLGPCSQKGMFSETDFKNNSEKYFGQCAYKKVGKDSGNLG